MADKLKTGDAVRCKGGRTVRIVVEVDPPGHHPLAPSTYVVRLAAAPDLKPDHWLYGDAALERAP